MVDQKTIILKTQLQADYACKVINGLPKDENDPWCVVIQKYDKVRTNAQNKLWWRWMGLLEQHAIDWKGMKHDKDYWHSWNAYKFLEPKIVTHPVTDEDMPVPASTSKLPKKKFKELIDEVSAYWLSEGIILPFPNEYDL